DDEDGCTQSDACLDGSCVGASISCDDDNACTLDQCTETQGDGVGVCTSTIASGFVPCDDGDACTTQDVCSAGFCVGGSAPDCDDQNQCTTDACDPVAGCTHTDSVGGCDDASACTINDVCDQGLCTGSAKVCDDLDPCNGVEACDGADGSCLEGIDIICDDGFACTADSCVVGFGCLFEPLDTACDDGEECTGAEVCTPGVGCTAQAPADGTLCDDNNPCTSADACASGQCLGTDTDCDDANVCTVDSCDSDQAGGCVSSPAPGFVLCDDGSVCTDDDHCDAGFCKGFATQCADGNVCTDDTCDLSGDCLHLPNVAACDDGDLCTTGDTCADSACGAGGPKDCDDGDPCTVDACSADACTNTPLDCSGLDAPCIAGVCVAGSCETADTPCNAEVVHCGQVSASFDGQTAAPRSFRGAVGSGGPVGVSGTGARSVRWGLSN
ncbi:MAG: hypothetical protein ACI9WU_004733, partial [Myxococcota bacterium]